MSSASTLDESAFERRKEELGLKPPTSKETAAVLYQRIKNGDQDISALSPDVRAALKKFLDQKGGSLSTPAPINWEYYDINPNAHDERLDAQQKAKEQKELALTQQKNTYTSDKTYHLDNSMLIGIGMICITFIVIAVLFLRHKQKS